MVVIRVNSSTVELTHQTLSYKNKSEIFVMSEESSESITRDNENVCQQNSTEIIQRLVQAERTQHTTSK